MTQNITLTGSTPVEMQTNAETYGYQFASVANGTNIVKIETRDRLSTGDIVGERNMMENIAKQIYPGVINHFLVKPTIKGLSYSMGVGTTLDDAISAAQ